MNDATPHSVEREKAGTGPSSVPADVAGVRSTSDPSRAHGARADIQASDPFGKRVDDIVRDIVEPTSHECDERALFPEASIGALRGAGLMSAAIPEHLGGLGLGLAQLSEIAQRLARGCGSTSMIWAMHQIQVACLAAAAEDAHEISELLRELAQRQALVASVTSEVGVGGNLRNSIAAVIAAGEPQVTFEKAASTISYAEQADAYLVTARRGPSCEADDQVAVLVRRDQVALEPTGRWDSMGMRGTVSPGYRFKASFDRTQILPVPFGDLANRVMVPWSHVLWAACWYGLALEAFARARRFALKRRRDSPDHADVRLAEAGRKLSLLKASLREAVDYLAPASDSMALLEIVRLNDLKVSASRLAFDVAETSLEVCGMAGYQERTPSSVARILRDLMSARLMIGNERILATNARLAPARHS